MIVDILLDGLFAAIAGIGFGAISQPPKRAYVYIAILAAVGHAFRYVLITTAGVDLATASLFGALAVGSGSLWFGKLALCPTTVLYIPALLPMIPGKIAYGAVVALIQFLQNSDNAEASERHLHLFLSNGLISLTVVFLLVVGTIAPMFLFPNRAYSMTKKKRASESAD